MTGSPASEASHESGDEHQSSQSKVPAVKDKECPYCHQQFTSSSLGRHLDQFLSKKKPDGVHDVDEIRKTRGGITRRTARNAKKERDSSHSARPSPVPQQSLTPVVDTLNRAPPGSYEMHINRPTWHSTGVITDPNTFNASTTASPGILASPPSKKRNFSIFTQDLNPLTAVESARALELSLREVLDSIRAANKHVHPTTSPFSFDVQTRSFPSLCLTLLPPPPTIFETSPMVTVNTTPVTNPPGSEHVPALRNKVRSMIDNWKWEVLRLAQRTTTNIADDAEYLTRAAAEHTEIALSHIESSYEHWMTHPPEIRAVMWNLEMMRALRREQDKSKALEERIEKVQQEASQLQQQVEYLSRCQWPREMALWPPERRTFDTPMREELRLINLTRTADGEYLYGERSSPSSSPSDSIHVRGDKWDFDKLVNKWKNHIREDRTRRMPAPQSAGPMDGISSRVKSDSELNGLSNGSGPAGSGSPVHNDERRRSLKPSGMKNISIISDL